MLNLLPSLCALLVGAASFAISYDTLRLEAVRVQAVADGWPSYLLPLLLDGGVLSGSAVLWKASVDKLKRPVFPFFFVAALVLLSVVVNVSHAGPSTLAKVIAALPPLVLLGCLELVQIVHRSPEAQPQVAQEETPSVTQTLGTQPGIQGQPASPQQPLLEQQVVVEQQVVPATPAQTSAQRPATAATVVETTTPAASSAPAPAAPSEGAAAAPIAAPVENLPTREVPVVAPAPVQTVTQQPAAPKGAPLTDESRPAAPRRQLRVAAAAPEDGDGTLASDRVRALFLEHLAAGGDPEDSKVAATIAEQAGVSATYVRKVIRPLRAAHLAETNAVTEPAVATA